LIGSFPLPPDRFKDASTTVLCCIVNQLDTARRFISNEVTEAKLSVDSASNKHIGAIIMICVGIDVTKDKHDGFILSSEGEVVADVFTIPNNAEGFSVLM